MGGEAGEVIRGLALCAGAGGSELALRLALKDRYRTVGYVERDAYAAATLVARMGEAALDPAPVWDDLATFNGHAWRDVVDLVAAGIPCQPWSSAGKKGGLADERNLVTEFARVVGEVGPSFVFVENVPGFVRVGLPRLLGELSELGFDAEWDVFSAAGVGAPHLRRRLYVLAWRLGAAVADTDARGLEAERVEKLAGLQGKRGCEPDGHGEDGGLEGPRQAAGGRIFPPGPSDREAWELAPEEAQPAVRRGSDGLAADVDRCWADRLRLSGNAWVPLVGAYALRTLAARALSP